MFHETAQRVLHFCGLVVSSVTHLIYLVIDESRQCGQPEMGGSPNSVPCTGKMDWEPPTQGARI